MRRVVTLKLSGKDKKSMDPKELDVSEYAKMPYFLCRYSFKLHNAGALDAALTDAQKETLLANFIADWKYGKALDFNPYARVGFDRIRTEARFYLGVEVDGFNDDATGLAQVIPDGTSQDVTFDVLFPTGRRWWLGPQHMDDGCMGRMQAKTAKLEVQSKLDDGEEFAGDFSIDGDVTIDIIPVEVPSKGDPFSLLPLYREYTEDTNVIEKLDDGVTDLLTETTYAHAASPLTDLLIQIRDLVLIDGLGPAEIIVPYNAIPNVPAEASIADKETYLVVPLPWVTRKEDLPTGKPVIRKNRPAELPTMHLSHRFTPPIKHEVLAAELDYIAAIADKPVKYVKLHVQEKRTLKNKATALLEPQVGFMAGDREFTSLPGYTAHKNGGEISVPKSLVDAAKKTYSERKAHGEHDAAEDVINTLAASIPGGVPTGSGFKLGSSTVHARVSGWFR